MLFYIRAPIFTDICTLTGFSNNNNIINIETNKVKKERYIKG